MTAGAGACGRPGLTTRRFLARVPAATHPRIQLASPLRSSAATSCQGQQPYCDYVWYLGHVSDQVGHAGGRRIQPNSKGNSHGGRLYSGLTEDLKVGSACAKTNNAASLESRKARGARIFQQAFTCHQATLGSEWVLPPAKALIEDMRPGDAHWYVSALRYSSAWSTQYFASDKP
jgi:hypothetical protein